MPESPLRARAAAAEHPAADHGNGASQPTEQAGYVPATLEPIEYTGAIEDPDLTIPVHIAWARVMRDVRAIGKGSLYNAAGTRYNFRGVDEVFNAVGPALRRHGVLILPVGVDPAYRDTRTSKNTPMRECTVKVAYEIIGPDGGRLRGEAQGEAVDTMDKATTKAMSVAYRNFILEALCVPTGLPDPEATGIERGERIISYGAYAAEAMDDRTSLGRLRQIRTELRDEGRLSVMVDTPSGQMRIGELIDWVGKERAAGRDPFPDDEPATPEPDGGEPS